MTTTGTSPSPPPRLGRRLICRATRIPRGSASSIISFRNNGGRVDVLSQDERRLERKFSGQSPPPRYETTVKDAHEHVQDGMNAFPLLWVYFFTTLYLSFDTLLNLWGVGNVASSATKAYSPPATKASSPTSTSQETNQSTAGATPSANKEGDQFDEFDPRGSMPGWHCILLELVLLEYNSSDMETMVDLLWPAFLALDCSLLQFSGQI